MQRGVRLATLRRWRVCVASRALKSVQRAHQSLSETHAVNQTEAETSVAVQYKPVLGCVKQYVSLGDWTEIQEDHLESGD